MIKILRYNIFGMICAFFLTLLSCTKTEKIDDFTILPPRLVLNSTFSEGEPFKIDLSHSLSVLDNASIKPILDAKIEIYENDQLVETISGASTDSMYYSEIVAEHGKKYQLKVSHPDYETIETYTEKLPAKAEQVSLEELIMVDSLGGFNEEYVSFMGKFSGKINFTDSKEEHSYYALKVLIIDSLFLE